MNISRYTCLVLEAEWSLFSLTLCACYNNAVDVLRLVELWKLLFNQLIFRFFVSLYVVYFLCSRVQHSDGQHKKHSAESCHRPKNNYWAEFEIPHRVRLQSAHKVLFPLSVLSLQFTLLNFRLATM